MKNRSLQTLGLALITVVGLLLVQGLVNWLKMLTKSLIK
jgi:hypothetical protein